MCVLGFRSLREENVGIGILQTVKKSWYAFFAFEVSLDNACARPSCDLAMLAIVSIATVRDRCEDAESPSP